MTKTILRYFLLFVLVLAGITAAAQTANWKDVYKAKKKDTVFGIARKYGITLQQLMDANPTMKTDGYQLKKGDMIYIPNVVAPSTNAQTVAPTAMAKEAAKKKDADIRNRAIRVGVMLPLHLQDGDGQRMVEYYRGMLLATDVLKKQKISVDIHAWNVAADADIRQVLLDNSAERCDIIFGPLYTRQVKPLANFCKTYGIRMVIPFSINGDEVAHNSQVFQVYQSADQLNQKAIHAFLERFPHHHPIFIDCNDTTSRKGLFTFGLRKQLDAKGVKYSITNLRSSEDMFAKAFSRKEPNVVVLNSGRSPELNIAFAKLNSLKTSQPGVSISLFGYTEWLMYTKYNLADYYKFDTYIPSTFYYNPLSSATQQVEAAYRRWFRTEPQPSLPRFVLVGYDHALFFLQGLHRYGAGFTGSRTETVTAPLQSPLYFRQIAGGGLQSEIFQLIHYKSNQTIDSVTY